MPQCSFPKADISKGVLHLRGPMTAVRDRAVTRFLRFVNAALLLGAGISVAEVAVHVATVQSFALITLRQSQATCWLGGGCIIETHDNYA